MKGPDFGKPGKEDGSGDKPEKGNFHVIKGKLEPTKPKGLSFERRRAIDLALYKCEDAIEKNLFKDIKKSPLYEPLTRIIEDPTLQKDFINNQCQNRPKSCTERDCLLLLQEELHKLRYQYILIEKERLVEEIVSPSAEDYEIMTDEIFEKEYLKKIKEVYDRIKAHAALARDLIYEVVEKQRNTPPALGRLLKNPKEILEEIDVPNTIKIYINDGEELYKRMVAMPIDTPDDLKNKIIQLQKIDNDLAVVQNTFKNRASSIRTSNRELEEKSTPKNTLHTLLRDKLLTLSVNLEEYLFMINTLKKEVTGEIEDSAEKLNNEEKRVDDRYQQLGDLVMDEEGKVISSKLGQTKILRETKYTLKDIKHLASRLKQTKNYCARIPSNTPPSARRKEIHEMLSDNAEQLEFLEKLRKKYAIYATGKFFNYSDSPEFDRQFSKKMQETQETVKSYIQEVEKTLQYLEAELRKLY